MIALGAACLIGQSDAGEPYVAAARQALADGRYAEAEEALSEALDRYQAPAGSERGKATALTLLARVYRAQGDLARPEDLYRQADQAARAAYGPESVEYADLLNEVGRYYHTRRKYDLAERFYKEGFRLRVAALGRKHVAVADSICNLGVLYENQTLYDKSETYYRTALDIRRELLGDDAIATVETLEHLARLLVQTQRGEQAEELLAEAQAARAERLQALLDAQPSGDAVTPGVGIDPPELVDTVEPVYTEEARIARHEGAVTLDVEIDRDGNPKVLGIVETLGLGLDENAIRAARQWRFRPARQGGRKVAYRARLEINFSLL